MSLNIGKLGIQELLNSALVKGLVGCSILTGGSCAVTLPLVLNSEKSTVNKLKSSEGREGHTSSGIVDNENGITSEKLGQRVERDGKDKQTNIVVSSLLGREQFMNILNENQASGDSGEVKKSEGKSCATDQPKIVYCGYLHLSNKKFEYKVNVSFSKDSLDDKGSWRVLIVRKTTQNSLLNYGAQFEEPHGKSVSSNFNFDTFVSFIEPSNTVDGGQDVETPSIVHKLETK